MKCALCGKIDCAEYDTVDGVTFAHVSCLEAVGGALGGKLPALGSKSAISFSCDEDGNLDAQIHEVN